MRKGIVSLTTASLLAGAILAAPAFSATETPAQSNDITVVGEAIMASPATPAELAAVADTTGDCTSTAYALEKWRLSGTHTWSYNPAGAPASVSGTAAATITKATANLVGGQNRCGTKTALAISQTYAGTSAKAAQISPTAACTGNDGVSVTSWGVLPTNVLGYTCVYYKTSTGAVSSSDMLLNSTRKWFTGNVPASCTDSFDLESVVTHERGHTAGLSHVDQTAQPRQTMSPRTLACTTYKRLVGSGDLKGLRALSGSK